jgi:hypothetical protein
MREIRMRVGWHKLRQRSNFRLLVALWLLFGALAFNSTASAQNQSQADLNTPLTAPGGPPGLLSVQAVAHPAPLIVQGKAYLAYELVITNFQTGPISLQSLRADCGPMGIFNFDGNSLKQMVDLPPRYGASADPLTFAPLETRMLLVWLPFSSSQVPRRVIHTIGYGVSGKSGTATEYRVMTAQTAPLRIDYQATPVEIGPPLRGNNWLAANGPSNTSSHRRAFMVANGQIFFPERFAIDFVQIGADGKTYRGDPKDNRSYHAYGADIIAVADGRIVDAKSGIKDNVPGSTAGPISMATIGGNYLVEDLGNGAYAFYAHLQPGSLKVFVGANVKRGQVLASLGNTGNSSEPHLHFHVMSTPSPLAGNGIPYAFDKFAIAPGQVNESSQDISFTFGTGQPQPVSDSLVLENALIDFPEDQQH